MISICAPYVHTSGAVVLQKAAVAGSNLKKKTARVSRSQTLDGGVYVNHSGVTDGDRTLTVKGRVTDAQAGVLDTIFSNYTGALISMADGLYYGAISSLDTGNGALKMTILLEQKET